MAHIDAVAPDPGGGVSHFARAARADEYAARAALLVMTDDGTGDKRKFALTDAAVRIIRDADPQSEKRREAIKRAALLPKIYEELWAKYKDASGVSQVVLVNYLTLDRKDEGKAPYGDDAAQTVIDEYKETVTFAGLSKTDSISAPPEEKDGNGASGVAEKPKDQVREPPIVKVGDYVQWTSNGADQFKVAKRVERVSEDAKYAFVPGSDTGLPVSELSVTDAPGRSKLADVNSSASENPIEVFMGANGRLQVSADVDAAGLAKLRDLLAKYDDILKLMAGKS